MAYTIEKSNATHPGIVIMQDGKSVQEVMPIIDFIDNCNLAGNLLDIDKKFLSFITLGFVSRDEFNNYLDTVAKLNVQFGDFFLKLKGKGLPIAIPDGDFWTARYNEITTKIDKGEVDRVVGAKRLAEEFEKTMSLCINTNKKTAEKYNIPVPKTPKEKKREEAAGRSIN